MVTVDVEFRTAAWGPRRKSGLGDESTFGFLFRKRWCHDFQAAVLVSGKTNTMTGIIMSRNAVKWNLLCFFHRCDSAIYAPIWALGPKRKLLNFRFLRWTPSTRWSMCPSQELRWLSPDSCISCRRPRRWLRSCETVSIFSGACRVSRTCGNSSLE